MYGIMVFKPPLFPLGAVVDRTYRWETRYLYRQALRSNNHIAARCIMVQLHGIVSQILVSIPDSTYVKRC
jgi:hypothetical protein